MHSQGGQFVRCICIRNVDASVVDNDRYLVVACAAFVVILVHLPGQAHNVIVALVFYVQIQLVAGVNVFKG